MIYIKKVIASVMMFFLLTYPSCKEENNTINLENEYSLTCEELEIFELVNKERTKNNLQELKIDNELENIARLKAKDMVENEYFSHTSPQYGNINDMIKSFELDYKNVAENIAGNVSVYKAVTEWMSSKNHKQNILSKKYTNTGIAVVNSTKYGKIFVQIFAK